MVIAASGLDKISKESMQAKQQRDLKIQSCFGASTFETWLEGKKKSQAETDRTETRKHDFKENKKNFLQEKMATIDKCYQEMKQIKN